MNSKICAEPVVTSVVAITPDALSNHLRAAAVCYERVIEELLNLAATPDAATKDASGNARLVEQFKRQKLECKQWGDALDARSNLRIRCDTIIVAG